MLFFAWPALQAALGPAARADARKIDMLEAQIGLLQERLASAQEADSAAGAAWPAGLSKDLKARIAELQAQAQRAQDGAEAALAQAEAAAQQVTQALAAQQGGALQDRLVELEQNVKALTGSAALQAWAGRLYDMAATQSGQQSLQDAATALAGVLERYKGDVSTLSDSEFSKEMQGPVYKNDTLRTVFNGVPPEDLKAAALLLGMSQLRTTLGRDNTPFADDLALLTTLAGKQDPALQESLQRLAPYSESGVLTPEGLAAEFQNLAAAMAEGALRGDDVSLQERAQARLNELFQVKKDGTLVTGTPTQTTLDKSETLLAQGDLRAAIEEMQSLSGGAATRAAPWISKAKASLAAQEAQRKIAAAMRSLMHGPVPYTTGAGAGLKAPGFQGLNVAPR